MIEIIKELDIEVTKPNIFQALVAKQYDMNTRFLKVTFKDCGTRIDIPNIETAKVVINAERKDGKSKGFDGVINDDGTVTVPLHSWMLELDGTVICDISVIDMATDNNKKLTTTSFTLLVEKAAFGGEDITTDPQFDVLVALLEAAPTAQASLDISNQALAISKEANSKYDACVEATNNANAVRENIEAGGYIESLKEMNQGGKFSFWVGTQAEYDAIEVKIANCFYMITDDNSLKRLSEVNEEIKNLKEANSKIKKVFFDVADNEGKLLDFSNGKTFTRSGFKDYSVFLIDGVICARYENKIKGTLSDRVYSDNTTEYTTMFRTLELTINGDTLAATNWEKDPVNVYTSIATKTGDIFVTHDNYIYSIIGIC